MFVLSVLEAPNTKTNSLCVQTHLAIKLFLILILTELIQGAHFHYTQDSLNKSFFYFTKQMCVCHANQQKIKKQTCRPSRKCICIQVDY